MDEDEKEFEEVFNEIGDNEDDFPRKKKSFKGGKSQKSRQISKKKGANKKGGRRR